MTSHVQNWLAVTGITDDPAGELIARMWLDGSVPELFLSVGHMRTYEAHPTGPNHETCERATAMMYGGAGWSEEGQGCHGRGHGHGSGRVWLSEAGQSPQHRNQGHGCHGLRQGYSSVGLRQRQVGKVCAAFRAHNRRPEPSRRKMQCMYHHGDHRDAAVRLIGVHASDTTA
jgi:hypothetical protein